VLSKGPSIILFLAAGFAATASLAHHSFAMFDLSRHRLVEGSVTSWDFNSPHSWLHIEGLDENGEMQTWSFEGAAPMHAARQGVSGTTFRKGEFIKVVMSPLRDGRPAGAMCFVIKEDDSIVRPNDGTCDALAIIQSWRANGWIDNTAHLAERPAIQPQ
jgi:hypothetical protein